MSIITLADLENAKQDLQTINDVSNQSETFNGTGIVTSRLGEEIKTLAKVIADLGTSDVGAQAAADIVNRLQARIAFADDTAFLAGTTDGDYGYVGEDALTFKKNTAGSAVEVEDDELRNILGVIITLQGAQDDLAAKISHGEGNDALAIADAGGHIMARMERDGKLHLVGLNSGSVQQEFDDIETSILADVARKITHGNGDTLLAIAGAGGRTAVRIDQDGAMHLVGLNSGSVQQEFDDIETSLSDKIDAQIQTIHGKNLLAVIDSSNKVIAYISQNGKLYLNGLGSGSVQQEFDDRETSVLNQVKTVIESVNGSPLLALIDSGGKLAAHIDQDGDLHLAKLNSGSIQQEFDDRETAVLGVINSRINSDDSDGILAIADAGGRVLAHISPNGHMILTGLNTESIQQEFAYLNQVAKTTEYINGNDLLSIVDSSPKIITRIDQNGELYLSNLTDSVQHNINSINTELMGLSSKIANIRDDDNEINNFTIMDRQGAAILTANANGVWIAGVNEELSVLLNNLISRVEDLENP